MEEKSIFQQITKKLAEFIKNKKSVLFPLQPLYVYFLQSVPLDGIHQSQMLSPYFL